MVHIYVESRILVLNEVNVCDNRMSVGHMKVILSFEKFECGVYTHSQFYVV